jgi:hypothetical protein
MANTKASATAKDDTGGFYEPSACVRFALTASIALAVGLAVAPIASAGDDPGGLKAFAGKYPFDRVNGRSLLQVPELRSRLQALLGRSGINDIDRLSVSVPVEEHAGWLVAHGCRPHNCSEEQWTVAVNLSDYGVRACLGLEGQPVRYAATGRKLVERPGKKESPCPEIADAVPAFERVFAAP